MAQRTREAVEQGCEVVISDSRNFQRPLLFKLLKQHGVQVAALRESQVVLDGETTSVMLLVCRPGPALPGD